MGSARTEITGLIMQPIGNDVFHTTETGSKQWFAMCHADEVTKPIELQFDHIYTGIRSAYSVNSLMNHTTRDARSMHECYEQKGDTIVKTLERSLNPSHALDIAQIELNPYGPKL